MTKVGFIGLGRMGKPMAGNLCHKGFELMVYDVNPAPVAELAAHKARAGKSANDAAAFGEIVVTMLPDSKVVEEVLLGSEGAMAKARSGAVFLEMSTVAPATTDRLAHEAERVGCGFVDAPVGRLASHADRGESLFMVGASEENFQRVKPLLEAMGTTIHHCGKVGTGIRTKLVNNYLAIILCQLNAEALALSQRFGLDLRHTLDVLCGTSAVNGQLQMNWMAKVLKGDIAPGFAIDLAHKDLTLIVDAANAAKVPVPVAAAAREAFSVARSRGFGGKDFSAMVDALCEVAGIEKPRL